MELADVTDCSFSRRQAVAALAVDDYVARARA